MKPSCLRGMRITERTGQRFSHCLGQQFHNNFPPTKGGSRAHLVWQELSSGDTYRVHIPRAAGMVKSTATQQQDTISDIKSPKSCTAGIYMKREHGVGINWSRRPRETSGQKEMSGGTREQHRLTSVMAVNKAGRYRAELTSGTGNIVFGDTESVHCLRAGKGQRSSTSKSSGAGGEGRKMLLAASLSIKAFGRSRKPQSPQLQCT